jgi:hypothetical protein
MWKGSETIKSRKWFLMQMYEKECINIVMII